MQHRRSEGAGGHGLDGTTIRAALPALGFNSPAHFIDVGRLRIPAEVQPSVPNVSFAESETNLIGRLIDADRQIPVAKQKAILGWGNWLA
jgi:hypothetical protein